jgi:hypothetical protein
MIRACLSLITALFLAAPVITNAQTSVPSAVYFSTDNGMGQPSRSWSIDATGAVNISGERCRGCRWHAPYQSQHQVDPERYREIATLLDLATLRKAAAAPCTLPRGDQNTPVESFGLPDSRTGLNERVLLLTLCASPEMDAALARIKKAHAIISAIGSK